MPIDWNIFRQRNKNSREAFEDLCYFLFCRKFNIKEGIKADFNEVGLETKPILINREYYGFQSKFFDHKNNYGQIEESVKKATEKFKGGLNKIYIYLNHAIGSSALKPSEIKDYARTQGVDIEWIVPSNFQILLNQPENLDLTQLYFGSGDEIGFIKGNIDPEKNTLLSSSEYIDLPFSLDQKSKSRVLKNVRQNILQRSQEEFLIVGHPGSGKSIFMYKLFREFGGLDQKNRTSMLKVIKKNSAVPMLINLKNCNEGGLENIIRDRQNDSSVRNGSYGFIYLFDGLDELNEEKADHVLSCIQDLKNKKNTKKIIMSCRSGNLNRAKSKVYFPEIIEYRIDNLEEGCIEKFFTAKGNDNKLKSLSLLKRENNKIIKEIKDVFLIKLLWDTIDNLNEKSTILDLLSIRIKLLLCDARYKKNIEELNLLNPKEERIIELNQEIAFEFQKKFQLRFLQKDLQKLILEMFNRLDYKSVNLIINYLSSLFFEETYSNNNENNTFVYQHRRYQEFFLLGKLKSEFEKDPKILRELKILSNRDFFEDLFLGFLRKEYIRNRYLPGLIELNLIDVYLGKDKGFGVDDSYYMNSSGFISSIACQEVSVFEELISDENLRILEKINIDFRTFKTQLKKWISNKNDFEAIKYLKGIWGSGITALMDNVVTFWKFNKKTMAYDLLKKLDKIHNAFKTKRIIEKIEKVESYHIQNPFYLEWKNWCYIRLVIKKEKARDIFLNVVRKTCKDIPEPEKKEYRLGGEEGKEKVIKSFFRVCLENKQKELFKLIEVFDQYELLSFLEVLSSEEFIAIFIKNKAIHKKIKTLIADLDEDVIKSNLFVLFYKKLLNFKISNNELALANSRLSKLRERREMDWDMYKVYIEFSLLSYITKENSFSELLREKKDDYHSSYYDELGLYAALFNDFIGLLRKNKSLEEIARNYVTYNNTHESYRRHYLRSAISFLWARIFMNSEAILSKKINLKKILITKNSNLAPASFLFRLESLDKNLFNSLINESDIEIFEKKLTSWDDDFSSYVDQCFTLSSLFSSINKNKAKFYIEKGIIEGILRHGWRKDPIVSYLLVDSLEIFWKKNWLPKKELEIYTEKIFELTLRVRQITDGKITWRGPYNVVDMISRYDLTLAEKLKEKVIENVGYQNFSNLVITSILLAKARLGLNIENIETGMEEYRQSYTHNHIPSSDSFEQKIKVYLEIATCDLYTKKERRESFEKAYKQIEEMKKLKVEYFLNESDFKEERLLFKKLCIKYGKKSNLPAEKKKDDYSIKAKMGEKEFISELKRAKGKAKIMGMYRRLKNYNNSILLKKFESWENLVNHTYKVCGNIEPFIKLLDSNYFPSTNFFTANSRYFHLGVAVALKNLDTRNEMLDYLIDNSGHGGFFNIIKAYEVNEDKEACLSLFKRFFRFCKFLVN